MKELYPLLIYFFLINIITFFLFLIDKIKAIKGSWRISEKTLILSSFLGGSFGGIIAMVLFRHKTKKPKFLIALPFILTLQIIAISVFLYKIF